MATPATERSDADDAGHAALIASFADSARDVAARIAQGSPEERAAWRTVATAGLFSTLLPESIGGLGLDLRFMVAVHDALGRTPIAAPVLACGLLPATLLAALSATPDRDAQLRGVIEGDCLLAVAWQERNAQIEPASRSSVTCVAQGGAWTLDGEKRWVVAARDVDAWLVDASDAGGTRHLFLVRADAQGVGSRSIPTIDGCVTILDLEGANGVRLASGDDATHALRHALDVARIAQAAELLGVAGASFALTLDYLKTRVQFGRPIGANQALQHRMVDAFVRIEMARAGLDAAVAACVDGKLALDEAASRVKARSADAAQRVTREAVQLHGAIGTTDEYALARYWRRSVLLAGWLGGAEAHAARHLDIHARGDASSAQAAAASNMDWANADAAAFRAIVRAFLAKHYPPALRNPTRRLRLAEVREWYLTLARHGWLAPAWPREHGGMGLTVDKLVVLIEEYEAYGVARLPDHGIIYVGPILIRYGSEAQRMRYLPKILSGEEIWCQGYSEPGAGSDLASLRTRAELDGDHFVVNGQKIWTTLAHDATHMFMLVRTSVEPRKHDGISFLLVDLASPGVTVRPIRNLAAEEEFCEVFFDDVRVPVENLVGKMGDGWKIGMAVLGHERLFVGSPKTSQHALAQMKRLGDARGLWSDATFRAAYGLRLLEVLELGAAFTRYVAIAGRGEDLPPSVSILKLQATETYTRIAADLVRFAGEEGACVGALELGDGAHAAPLATLLNASVTRIYGGSNEIQRNIVARRVLELPGS